MPQTIDQWLGFVAVVVAGTIVSLGVQWIFMKKLLNPRKLADRILPTFQMTPEQQAEWRRRHLGTSLQEWVGAMEIVLYSTAIVFSYPEFIAVWFATKYIATWRGWAEEQAARSFYNRSLFGSGLNILLGAATGGAADMVIALVP